MDVAGIRQIERQFVDFEALDHAVQNQKRKRVGLVEATIEQYLIFYKKPSVEFLFYTQPPHEEGDQTVTIIAESLAETKGLSRLTELLLR